MKMGVQRPKSCILRIGFGLMRREGSLSSSAVNDAIDKGQAQASTPGVGSGGETVVMKFGGTSVAGPEDLKRAAARIVAERQRGNKVVAVLSARGKTTDELLTMAGEISDSPSPREMDIDRKSVV